MAVAAEESFGERKVLLNDGRSQKKKIEAECIAANLTDCLFDLCGGNLDRSTDPNQSETDGTGKFATANYDQGNYQSDIRCGLDRKSVV